MWLPSQENQPDKEEYLKYCGKRFWEFISGNNELYLEIIVPLGYKAKERNDEFREEYSALLNKFTEEFGQRFCADGKIDWDALVKFNSSADKPSRLR